MKTGPQTIEIPGAARVRIVSEGQASLFTVDPESGELVDLVASSVGNQIVFHVKQPLLVHVKVPAGAHWAYEVYESKIFDKSDPVPFEAPEGPPESLADKVKRMAGQMAMHMFGRDSREVETLEESLNFDLNDDGEIGRSGFEVMPSVELEPGQAGATPSGVQPKDAPQAEATSQVPAGDAPPGGTEKPAQ